MIASRAALTGFGLIVVLLTGCETTAEKSARLAAQAKATVKETGLSVSEVNRDVKVLDRATLTDSNGTAVVVLLRQTTRRAMADVPIAIDVLSATGKLLFRNDQPGADPGLVSAPLLSPGRTFSWVHDQVQAPQGQPARVTVRVGEPRGEPPVRPPRMTLGGLTVEDDGAGGTEGRGRLTNRSPETHRRVTVYAVARRGGKVVAAGRAVVNRVAPGRSAPFAVYFIGDPRGARVTLSAAAPPAASEGG